MLCSFCSHIGVITESCCVRFVTLYSCCLYATFVLYHGCTRVVSALHSYGLCIVLVSRGLHKLWDPSCISNPLVLQLPCHRGRRALSSSLFWFCFACISYMCGVIVAFFLNSYCISLVLVLLCCCICLALLLHCVVPAMYSLYYVCIRVSLPRHSCYIRVAFVMCS